MVCGKMGYVNGLERWGKSYPNSSHWRLCLFYIRLGQSSQTAYTEALSRRGFQVQLSSDH